MIESELNVLAGIDFGAKLAGTTSMTVLKDSKFEIHDCKKGDDADVWILEQVERQAIKTVFIDAPLSLPPATLIISRTSFFIARPMLP